ncbi:predicted protein [Uncinocarpus reesii 1704]|uniref:Uncharacterized protein n=1 Tax=Uncinocarpus reesii (strain UAMH 1704) TaxID=336963 RepID=C4JZM2_UNCRE|nr:uncharacterized protein UREG_07623 [Uncinocarpus reesii 1704]EEP82758.1 predicted protein [Uncinocarpus reesii 1704]
MRWDSVRPLMDGVPIHDAPCRMAYDLWGHKDQGSAAATRDSGIQSIKYSARPLRFCSVLPEPGSGTQALKLAGSWEKESKYITTIVVQFDAAFMESSSSESQQKNPGEAPLVSSAKLF